MAIPNNQLSSFTIPAHFLPPDDLETYPLMVFELGGTGLNNPNDGLTVQTWTLRYYPDTGNVSISAANQTPTTLFTRSGITEIDLTFDQNMEPFVAFVENGDAKFFWYDTQLGSTTFTDLPAGSLTPRCSLDDKRDFQDAASDIILAYVHGGALKYRQQRERYETERTLMDPFIHPEYELPAVLKKIGRNEQNRLQFLCDLANPLDWCGYKAEA
jgi:hypothetical protein